MTSTVLSEISDDTVDIFFLNEMVKPLPGPPIAIYANQKSLGATKGVFTTRCSKAVASLFITERQMWVWKESTNPTTLLTSSSDIYRRAKYVFKYFLSEGSAA